ncbi:MAG: hypothetical protein WBV06_02985 [Acidimicrobiia bacterium]
MPGGPNSQRDGRRRVGDRDDPVGRERQLVLRQLTLTTIVALLWMVVGRGFDGLADPIVSLGNDALREI